MTILTEANYAGNLSPQDAFGLLTSDASARLVDVRTNAEWAFVGYVDLSACGKAPLFVEWQSFPTMQRNAGFVADVEAGCAKSNGDVAISKDAPLLFLCRSGVRSKAAADEMARHGYTQCLNVTEGFEGDLDQERRRGGMSGWKVRGLPWSQQ